jgi:hypothetical protein
MYLKREPPKSLPKPPFLKNCFSTRERPARTPPSTFLFLPIHFSNSPEIMAISAPRSAVEARTSEKIGCRFTVPVRSFRGAQSRRKRTARRWGYIGFAPDPCQPAKRPVFRSRHQPISHIPNRLSLRRRNQVLIHSAPHSGHIPRSSLVFTPRDGIGVQVEGWNRYGATGHRHSDQSTRFIDPSLTGGGPTGIVSAVIQRPVAGERH